MKFRVKAGCEFECEFVVEGNVKGTKKPKASAFTQCKNQILGAVAAGILGITLGTAIYGKATGDYTYFTKIFAYLTQETAKAVLKLAS